MPNSNFGPEHIKMLFRLVPDDDGYPPVAVEGLWVKKLESGNVILDNVPFYAKGIASGDELAVQENTDGETWFDELVCSDGASVFRIISQVDKLLRIREDLLDLGLPSEVSLKMCLIAVEVPLAKDIVPVLNYLVSGRESRLFDFEEGVLRHAIPV